MKLWHSCQVKILKTQEDYLRALKEAIRGASAIDFASYNTYLSAVIHRGRFRFGPNGALLKSLNNLSDCSVRVIIGAPKKITEEGLRQKMRFFSETFQNISFKSVRKSHLKLVIIHQAGETAVFTGGRNLMDSSWTDLMLQITGPLGFSNELCDFYNSTWDKGRDW